VTADLAATYLGASYLWLLTGHGLGYAATIVAAVGLIVGAAP
jgi:hypothetical protein